VTHDDPLLAGKIAWAHINEHPDYYTRLEQMEADAGRYWAAHASKPTVLTCRGWSRIPRTCALGALVPPHTALIRCDTRPSPNLLSTNEQSASPDIEGCAGRNDTQGCALPRCATLVA